jgi:uncharacterized glyoxalase superfamily protein PhnB
MKNILFESLAPNVIVDDVNRAVEYYTTIFGFTLLASVPETGKFNWAMVQHGSVILMFQSLKSLQEDLPTLNIKTKGSLGTFYIKVKNVDQLYESVKGKVEIAADMRISFYNAKEFTVKDLNGYFLTFAEDVA